MTGFPKFEKLEQLKKYFDRPETSKHSKETKSEDDWCTWDENWDRVMKGKVLNWSKKGWTKVEM
jgi:hypothetical protein